VLFVDDDSATREGSTAHLVSLGFDVMQAAKGGLVGIGCDRSTGVKSEVSAKTNVAIVSGPGPYEEAPSE
jgi:hypothetical protein